MIRVLPPDLVAVLAGSLAQNRMRSLIALGAVALGVALGFAVHLVNASAVAELAQGMRAIAGDADLSLRGPRTGFDEALFARLARDRDVAVASPVVEVETHAAGKPLRVLGLDLFRAGWIQPELIGEATDRLDTLRGDTIFLSAAALRALDAAIGDAIVVQAGLRDVRLRVAGPLAGGGGEVLGVMDIAGAQEAFDRLGRLSRVDLRLVPGATPADVAARLRAALPAGVAIDTPDASLRAAASVSRSYRINLDVLALVALFTGALLVFTTQALAVVRRRAQFALLRVLGVTRRRLALIVAAEGALIGVLGALAGLGIGYALALAALRVAGPDLGSGYFRGVEPALRAELPAMLVFFALGVGAALAGSIVPAREAARAAPARALKAGDEEEALARLRPATPGIAVLAVGAVLAFLPPVGGIAIAGYASIACLLIGTILLLPRLTVTLLHKLPVPRHPAAALATAQLQGTPGQVSVSLAAIVASVSLMASMAIMVHSFRVSLDAWLLRVLPAEAYVRVPPGSTVAALSPDDQARMRALPPVGRVEFVREEQLLLEPARPRVVLLARELAASNAAAALPLVDAPVALAAGAPAPIWVNEAMVDLFGFTAGRVVELPLAGQPHRFTVAGVWRDYGRPQGAVVIERDRYVALTGDRFATGAALWLAPGHDLASARAAVSAAIDGGERLEIGSPGEIRDAALAAFDRTFAVTYALEAAAVAIGLVGLSTAFGSRVLSRRREFGVLRHLGMTRRQVGAMLAVEGLVTAAFGAAAGLSLGGAISVVLIHVVNRQSFHWGMELSVPVLPLTLLALSIVALATATAVVSGRQAMQIDAVRAVRDDW